MLRHIIRRLLLAIPTLLVVVTIIFLIVRVIPGNPAVAALGEYASADAVHKLEQQLGLDKPIWRQYVDYMSALAHGDPGRSMINRRPAMDQIKFVLPYTLELTAAAMLIALLLGIPAGVLTAVKRNTMPDYVGRVLSLAGLSAPSFYVGLLFIYFFAARLGWLPAIGAGDFQHLGKNLETLILPAVTLGLVETAYIARMTRSVMLNVLAEDYVRTARAKGLAERVVLSRHAIRAALVPIVSLVGIFTISLIGNSVLVETVFARPGLGKLMVGAADQRDYTMLQAVMIIYAVIIIVINIVVDLVYTFVDPRIRYE
jgi:ABC-type dipeptide/oligopeptide/nickel transport system permease component